MVVVELLLCWDRLNRSVSSEQRGGGGGGGLEEEGKEKVDNRKKNLILEWIGVWGRERKEREKEGRFFKQNQKSCTNIVLCVCEQICVLNSIWMDDREGGETEIEWERGKEWGREKFVCVEHFLKFKENIWRT